MAEAKQTLLAKIKQCTYLHEKVRALFVQNKKLLDHTTNQQRKCGKRKQLRAGIKGAKIDDEITMRKL